MSTLTFRAWATYQTYGSQSKVIETQWNSLRLKHLEQKDFENAWKVSRFFPFFTMYLSYICSVRKFAMGPFGVFNVATVPQKDIIILLPYLGLHSNQPTKRLKSCVKRFYSFVNVRLFFKTHGVSLFLPIQGPSQPITIIQSHS